MKSLGGILGGFQGASVLYVSAQKELDACEVYKYASEKVPHTRS